MGKIIAVANQKGGVGKTTTAVNLAAALQAIGKKTLLVDFDPQGNASSGYGVDHSRGLTVYECILGTGKVEDAIRHTDWGDCLPAGVNLSGAEIELIALDRREYRLRDCLRSVSDGYDYIFIDCPPSLGMLTLNALAVCDTVLVPMQCEYYALEGLSQLVNSIKTVKKKINPAIDIEGIVLTMYDGRTNLTIQVAEEIKKYFGKKVYKTVIPRNVRLSEAPSHGLPIIGYDRTSRGAEAYNALAAEFVSKN